MEKRAINQRTIFPLVAFFLLLLACNLTSVESNPASSNPDANLPAQPVADATKNLSSATLQPPPDSSLASATETIMVTLTKAIQHISMPGGQSGTARVLTDINSQPTASQGRAPGGDDFKNNRYERPFLAQGMAYLPDVDITKAELSIVAPWVYVTIYVVGDRPEGIGNTLYGVELDTNLDNRGEYLIWGASPASTEWTTNGVQVWMDSNSDVGGPTPQIADGVIQGNGYDKNLFSGGQGADPDMAWIRKGGAAGQIQLAFKYTAVNSAPKFFWNAIADFSMQKPAWFDYNDHFTLEQAGLPLGENAFKANYPLKQLFGMDNTCRDVLGFEPVGDEPGLCTQPVVPGSSQGCIIGYTGGIAARIPVCRKPCPVGVPNFGPCTP
jgi:hypothetical protein